MEVSVHLPNGLPADQLPGVVEELQRHFPEARAFVGLSTDEELLERVHAAYPQADILVRFYSPDRMWQLGDAQALEDFEWVRRHPWVRDFVPANEWNLPEEHSQSPVESWRSEAGYKTANMWLLEWAVEFRRLWDEHWGPNRFVPLHLHWPALSPQPDEAQFLSLCKDSLLAYHVIDLHTYHEEGLGLRIERYQALAPRELWVTECNGGQGQDQRSYITAFGAVIGPTIARQGVTTALFFIFDSADPAFDWCNLRKLDLVEEWADVARAAKDWPVKTNGGDMTNKYEGQNWYPGWLAEAGGAEAILERKARRYAISTGRELSTLEAIAEATAENQALSDELSAMVLRLPKAP